MSLRISCLLAAAVLVCGVPSSAQNTAPEWSQRLVGHPLYLRDGWTEDKLDFTPEGKPSNQAHRGSLTLSGIDVTEVKISRDLMQLRGQRVVLFAPAGGERLQRTAAINSTTQMPFTHARQYRANEPVQFTVHADRQGRFDAAITHIFADGLTQMAASAPPYWSCYAAAYFIDGPPADRAAQDVLQCAESQSRHLLSSTSTPAHATPPAVLDQIPVTGTRAAAELHLAGASTVYATITARGLPTEFQVIAPLGAGVDETVLQAFSQFKFRAAMLDGKPVSSGFQFSVAVGPE